MTASPGGTDPLQGRRTWATSFPLNTKPSERSRDIKATAPQRDEQDKLEGTELAALKLLASFVSALVTPRRGGVLLYGW